MLRNRLAGRVLGGPTEWMDPKSRVGVLGQGWVGGGKGVTEGFGESSIWASGVWDLVQPAFAQVKARPSV